MATSCVVPAVNPNASFEIGDAMSARVALESNELCGRGLPRIVGDSAALRLVLDMVKVVATTDATVLINGETGTGKEVIARAIHEASPRRQNRFVVLNCAAIPGTLLESELFGHERGAFTGAVAQNMGRLQSADRGTLFLDEIGELPLGSATQTSARSSGTRNSSAWVAAVPCKSMCGWSRPPTRTCGAWYRSGSSARIFTID